MRFFFLGSESELDEDERLDEEEDDNEELDDEELDEEELELSESDEESDELSEESLSLACLYSTTVLLGKMSVILAAKILLVHRRL